MTLPHPHRAFIKAFWVLMTLTTSGLLCSAAWMMDSVWGIMLGIGFLCVSFPYGLMEINMRVMLDVYKAWNKLATFVAEVLRAVSLSIAFFVIFVVAGRFGSSLRLEMPKSNASLWNRRQTIPLLAYESQSVFPKTSQGPAHWGKFFISWATQAGKYWVWGLFPCLFILSFLDKGPSDETPANIYTLY